jgi:8-oxo-dGTP diphosphatase
MTLSVDDKNVNLTLSPTTVGDVAGTKQRRRSTSSVPLGCDTEPGATEAGGENGHPVFAVTVDVVILSVVERRLEVLLVQRGGEPFKGRWALPGGFKRPDETLDAAAARELVEETGVRSSRRLTQFGAYGDPGRDPRGNVVSVGYLAVTPDVGPIAAGTDASDARLVPVGEVLDETLELAFDHLRILGDAVERARDDLEDGDLATAFVGPTFTLSELQGVYEAIWGERLDPANFRRSLAVDSADRFVEPTGDWAPSGPRGGRRPELYRPAPAWQGGSPVRRPRRDERGRRGDA